MLNISIGVTAMIIMSVMITVTVRITRRRRRSSEQPWVGKPAQGKPP